MTKQEKKQLATLYKDLLHASANLATLENYLDLDGCSWVLQSKFDETQYLVNKAWQYLEDKGIVKD